MAFRINTRIGFSQTRWWASSLFVAATFGLQGCDVTSDDIGNSADPTSVCGFAKVDGGGLDSDPVVVDFPIAYVERALPTDDNGNTIADDALDPAAFQPCARLIVRTRASAAAPATVISDSAFLPVGGDGEPEPYDVKDIAVSPDALKIAFAMRAPEIENADEDEQPTWNLWQYDFENQRLSRIIDSDIRAQEGNDVSPAFLSDGRIVFSSDRQLRAKSILLDESTFIETKQPFAAGTEDNRNEPTFNLHVIDPDTGNLDQITYNQSHDLDPYVMDDGRVVFMRWDTYNNNRLSLYTTSPDGSNTSLLYGYDSQNTGTDDAQAAFVKPLELPDGRILVSLRPRESSRLGGDITAIDVANFADVDQLIPGGVGTEAQVSLSPVNINSNDGQSPFGYYHAAYPIADGTDRLLASYSACLVNGIAINVYVNANNQLIGNQGQLVDRNGDDADTAVVVENDEIQALPCNELTLDIPGVVESDPRFGLWILDPVEETRTPVILGQGGMMITDPVVIDERPLPTFIPPVDADPDVNTELLDSNLGVVHIRSVYDIDGVDTAEDGIAVMADPVQTPGLSRPARFLRIVKAVSVPDDDLIENDEIQLAVGAAGGQRMKEILGYVPIEPDGSAMFTVPADVAFSLSILDSGGARIRERHQNWLTVRAGETRDCNGCHTRDSEYPHGRADAEAPSANAGALAGIAFPNTLLRLPDPDPSDAFPGAIAPPPLAGETMAQYYGRVIGPRTPSMDIVYTDEWSDPDAPGFTPDVNISYRYSSNSTPSPSTCDGEWNDLCRTVISYLDHIQPIWELSPRNVVNPVTSDIVDVGACVSCHNSQNNIPSGLTQLDLRNIPTPARNAACSNVNNNQRARYTYSYSDLLFSDAELIDDAGNIADAVQGTNSDGALLFQALDENGNLIGVTVDDPRIVGTPIPFLVCGRASPVLSPNGAAASDAFFNAFFNPSLTVVHEDFLSPSETKLIREWIDLGGQYYNNPFDAVAED